MKMVNISPLVKSSTPHCLLIQKENKYKTLDGLPVEPVEPGTVRDCREFIKKYNEVENFNIYGNERFYLSIYFREVSRG